MYAVYNTKIGKLKISYADNFITGISKVDDIQDNGIRTSLTDKVNSELEE